LNRLPMVMQVNTMRQDATKVCHIGTKEEKLAHMCLLNRPTRCDSKNMNKIRICMIANIVHGDKITFWQKIGILALQLQKRCKNQLQ